MTDLQSLYTPERQDEIINNFRQLLMDADNFPRGKDRDDFKPFWVGLRGDGANMLGLTVHLLESLTSAKTIIDKLVSEKNTKADE